MADQIGKILLEEDDMVSCRNEAVLVELVKLIRSLLVECKRPHEKLALQYELLGLKFNEATLRSIR
jgi:hypothetical protein